MISDGILLLAAKIYSQTLIPTPGDNPRLAQAFQSGEFEWNDFLYYGLYLIKIGIVSAGGFFVIQLILAGYAYMFGSLVEDKEKGQTAIKNAFIGFALAVGSWAGVDIFITFLTT